MNKDLVFVPIIPYGMSPVTVDITKWWRPPLPDTGVATRPAIFLLRYHHTAIVVYCQALLEKYIAYAV